MKKFSISVILLAGLSWSCEKNPRPAETQQIDNNFTGNEKIVDCPKGYTKKLDDADRSRSESNAGLNRNDTNQIHPDCVPMTNYGENQPAAVDEEAEF